MEQPFAQTSPAARTPPPPPLATFRATVVPLRVTPVPPEYTPPPASPARLSVTTDLVRVTAAVALIPPPRRADSFQLTLQLVRFTVLAEIPPPLSQEVFPVMILLHAVTFPPGT